jgi:L-threonylcarbamoyladenylate synthase
MLREVLPDVRVREGASESASSPQRSPGLLGKHYSPRAPLTLYEGSEAIPAMARDANASIESGRSVGVLITSDEHGRLANAIDLQSRSLRVVIIGSASDPSSVAVNLYAALRELDAAQVDLIVARGLPSDAGLGAAVRDRLRRAAAGRIVRT